MNIKTAKQEISNSVQAYLAKDDKGQYLIPTTRQRPILMIGAPGIGKTAIMEQVAQENKIALVSYTITHHTRNSAIGMPQVVDMHFDREAFSVTKYTMSEIIASVYRKMSITSVKEGILFLDEINCVDESLAPQMLQFLQCKTFGNYRVPDGWVIVVAGNPKEYNSSVRAFDIATLDRMKKMEIEPDFNVWMEYAWKSRVHSMVISYLYSHRDNFFKITIEEEEKSFVTARAWEDLSDMLKAYEHLDYEITVDLIKEYVQDDLIAEDFIEYYNKIKNIMNSLNVEDDKVSAFMAMQSSNADEVKYALVIDKVCELANKVYDCEYEKYFSRNVLNMTNDIFEIYRRNMTDFRYDTYSVAEVKRQKVTVHEETNFLSANEMAGLKNAIKYVDDIAVKHARGMDEVLYADEMQTNVSKEFEHIIPDYEKCLLDTQTAIKEAKDFAQRVYDKEAMELFEKSIEDNYHIRGFADWANEPLMSCEIVPC